MAVSLDLDLPDDEDGQSSPAPSSNDIKIDKAATVKQLVDAIARRRREVQEQTRRESEESARRVAAIRIQAAKDIKALEPEQATGPFGTKLPQSILGFKLPKPEADKAAVDAVNRAKEQSIDLEQTLARESRRSRFEALEELHDIRESLKDAIEAGAGLTELLDRIAAVGKELDPNLPLASAQKVPPVVDGSGGGKIPPVVGGGGEFAGDFGKNISAFLQSSDALILAGIIKASQILSDTLNAKINAVGNTLSAQFQKDPIAGARADLKLATSLADPLGANVILQMISTTTDNILKVTGDISKYVEDFARRNEAFMPQTLQTNVMNDIQSLLQNISLAGRIDPVVSQLQESRAELQRTWNELQARFLQHYGHVFAKILQGTSQFLVIIDAIAEVVAQNPLMFTNPLTALMLIPKILKVAQEIRDNTDPLKQAEQLNTFKQIENFFNKAETLAGVKP